MMQSHKILPFQQQVPDQTNPELLKKKKLQAQYTRSWLWRSLFALLSVDGFSHSVQKMAKSLKSTSEEMLAALEGLESLGLIKRTVDGYQRILKYVYFSDRDLDPQSVLTDHVLISSQILNRLNPAENNFCFYRTGFVATNEKLAKEFCQDLEALMKNFLQKSSQETADCVMAMSFSQVQVSDKIEVASEQ